jgi:DNA-binding GntR family transcriptional regulator
MPMDDMMEIDRRAETPPFIQLANILKAQIDRGAYLPRDRLPSESELCKRYQVSPMTVRRCIKALLDQGIVTTIQGSGTYVKAPDLERVTFSMEEFYNLFRDKKNTRVRILETSIIRADEMIANRLSVPSGEWTVLIKRLLVQDGDPVVHHKEHLLYDPALPIVEAELEVTSLHGLFVGTGETNLKRAEMTIEAVVLTQEEADALNTFPARPAFRMEHTFYDFDDRPVSWGRFTCRGDRFRFTATVGIYNSKSGRS